MYVYASVGRRCAERSKMPGFSLTGGARVDCRWLVQATTLIVVGIAALLHPPLAVASGGWSKPVAVDRPANGTLTSVSCPSASFCVAVDNGANNSDGHAMIFSGSAWSSPTKIDSDQYGPVSVSCPSRSFCATVDGSNGNNGGGSALTFDGSVWSAPTGVSNDSLNAVSCASSSFCVAVSEDSYTFNGTSWSAATTIGNGESFDGVSCPSSSSSCAAVGHNGSGAVFDGSSWSTTASIDPDCSAAGVVLIFVVLCRGRRRWQRGHVQRQYLERAGEHLSGSGALFGVLRVCVVLRGCRWPGGCADVQRRTPGAHRSTSTPTATAYRAVMCVLVILRRGRRRRKRFHLHRGAAHHRGARCLQALAE